MRLIIIAVLLVGFTSCSNEHDIVGRWKYVIDFENTGGNSPNFGGVFEMRFQSDGEVILFLDGLRTGIGKSFYKIKGDSIFQTNIESEGIITEYPGRAFSISYDRLTVQLDSTKAHYVRVE